MRGLAPKHPPRPCRGCPANRDFRVLEWKGDGDEVREIARYSRKLKPEGITRAVIDGKARTLIVFDTGRFTVLD